MPERSCVFSAVSGGVLICGLFISGCDRSPPARAQAVRPVKTQVVSAADAARARSFPGRVEASRRAELAFNIPGILDQLLVKEGQRVAKGEVIAQLRREEYQARVAVAKGTLEQAKARATALRAGERPEEVIRREAQVRIAEARVENAKAEYDRYARVLPSRGVSQSEYEMSLTRYKVAQEELKAAQQMFEKATVGRTEDIQAAEADVRAIEGRVAEAELQLADSVLVAPYDGVIARRFVDERQNVPAKSPVVELQETDNIDVAVDVPESVMASGLLGTGGEMFAEYSGAPGKRYPVVIEEVALSADPVTQTFRVRVRMPSPTDVRILPGMTAVVFASEKPRPGAAPRLVVPITAIYKDASGEQVAWIIGPNQTVSRRPVKIGAAAGSSIEVLDGLRPGDRIAVAGVTFLRDGDQVRDLGDALGGAAQ